METPKYIEHLEIVANRAGRHNDQDKLYEDLLEAWNTFESYADDWAYDILRSDFPHVSNMERLLELLYRAPEASVEKDAAVIREKNREYGGSWHRRGGQGAFFMLSRKWDRIEVAVKTYGSFSALLIGDQRQEGILDDIGDLRRYLVLVLAWHDAVKHPIQEVLEF